MPLGTVQMYETVGLPLHTVSVAVPLAEGGGALQLLLTSANFA